MITVLRIMRLALVAIICAPFVVLVAPILFWLGRPNAPVAKADDVESDDDSNDPGVDVDD